MTFYHYFIVAIMSAFLIIVNFLDEAIGRVKDACDKHGYVMMVTADHGNAEQMISEKGGPHTAHTTYRGKLRL